MKIAFHAPLKSPDHPLPSGDRLMARLLVAALRMAGHQVEVVSQLRTFIRENSGGDLDTLLVQAEAEQNRIAAAWQENGPPDLWFTYHPYYKAPDLLGPLLCRTHGIAYVTAEASYSARRNIGSWSRSQAMVLDATRQAVVNICLTDRDRTGLLEAAPDLVTARIVPFIDARAFLLRAPQPISGRLITVAMMRSGDKMDSYRLLAGALGRIRDADWTLSIVGDGPCRPETEALFAGFAPGRIVWHGEQDQSAIADLLSESAAYAWPGCGEAYGLAYLEAQAAGLPVIAQAIAGVPEVVEHARTGLLTPAGDEPAYAEAILRMLEDNAMRAGLAAEARRFVSEERSIGTAATRLDDILRHAARRS